MRRTPELRGLPPTSRSRVSLISTSTALEVGKGGVTTAQKEIEDKYGFPVASIVSMAEVTEHLYNRECGRPCGDR